MQAQKTEIYIDVDLADNGQTPKSELAEAALQQVMAWLAGTAGWRARSIEVKVGGLSRSYQHANGKPGPASLAVLPGDGQDA